MAIQKHFLIFLFRHLRKRTDAVACGRWDGETHSYHFEKGSWEKGRYEQLVDGWVDDLLNSFEHKCGCYGHIVKHLSCTNGAHFSAAYQKDQKACYLIASAIALPNLIIKRGNTFLLLAAFNHVVGHCLNGHGSNSQWVPVTHLLVVVDASGFVQTSYPHRGPYRI